MNRRSFLTSTAGLALSTAAGAVPYADQKPRRVGLIGSGWYGKSDLLRLVQVAPVEIVSLCDVDKRMLSEAAEIVASRQKSGKKPRTFTRLPQDARGEGPRHRRGRHARPLARAGDDRSRQVRSRCVPPEADQRRHRRRPGDARGRPQVQPRRPGRNAAPQHPAPDRSTRQLHREGKLGKIALVEICCYYHMRDNANPPDTAPPEYLDYEMCTGPAPLRPYNKIVHPRAGAPLWSTATASSATCASTCST